MNTKKQKKAGFTLVELMVVAIIVAIMMAVVVPMVTGNQDSAVATEAQAGCNAVATALKLHFVENGTSTNAPSIADLKGISDDDLKGTYFRSYTVDSVGGKNTYKITAAPGDGKATASVSMEVTDGAVEWTGLGQ